MEEDGEGDLDEGDGELLQHEGTSSDEEDEEAREEKESPQKIQKLTTIYALKYLGQSGVATGLVVEEINSLKELLPKAWNPKHTEIKWNNSETLTGRVELQVEATEAEVEAFLKSETNLDLSRKEGMRNQILQRNAHGGKSKDDCFYDPEKGPKSLRLKNFYCPEIIKANEAKLKDFQATQLQHSRGRGGGKGAQRGGKGKGGRGKGRGGPKRVTTENERDMIAVQIIRLATKRKKKEVYKTDLQFDFKHYLRNKDVNGNAQYDVALLFYEEAARNRMAHALTLDLGEKNICLSNSPLKPWYGCDFNASCCKKTDPDVNLACKTAGQTHALIFVRQATQGTTRPVLQEGLIHAINEVKGAVCHYNSHFTNNYKRSPTALVTIKSPRDLKRVSKEIKLILKNHRSKQIKPSMIPIKSYCDHCGVYDTHWSTDCDQAGKPDAWKRVHPIQNKIPLKLCSNAATPAGCPEEEKCKWCHHGCIITGEEGEQVASLQIQAKEGASLSTTANGGKIIIDQDQHHIIAGEADAKTRAKFKYEDKTRKGGGRSHQLHRGRREETPLGRQQALPRPRSAGLQPRHHGHQQPYLGEQQPAGDHSDGSHQKSAAVPSKCWP